MDLRQLRYFVALARTRNFHRAAELLHISQPPLSVAIRKLEEEIGVALFHREPRGVRLTDAGAAALPAASAALAQAEQVAEAARMAGRGIRGSLTIGFVGSAVSDLLPRIVSPFRTKYPGVELTLREANSVEILRGIAAREIDIGLVRLPVMDSADVAIDVIERDELIVALSDDDAFPHAAWLDLADLAASPFIIYNPISVLHATIRLACQAAGFIPRIAQEATQVQTILSLVQAGLGVALVPARSARSLPDGVRVMPLRHRLPIEMGIARLPDARPLTRNFVDEAIATNDTPDISVRPQ